MSGQVMAVVGAQFGSEGKGLAVEKICRRFDFHVRTGAPNAGHTYYVDEYVPAIDVPTMRENAEPTGERVKVVARSVPVGAANPGAQLVIGAGGLIDIGLLIQEVQDLDALGLRVSDRIMVDAHAMVIDPVRHHAYEGGVGGDAHRLIGSTGEGVGPARMAKIARGTHRSPAPAWSRIDQAMRYRDALEAAGVAVGDTAQLLNEAYDHGARILLEGTQGSGLSLTHGPWPYVTSHDTNAATLAADAGLAPQLVSDVLLVVRTLPIRVAGNSGPLPLETSWDEVGVEPEHTTVTKKERRIGRFYNPTVRRAVMLNRPTEVAIMFADYMWPSLSGLSGFDGPPPDGLLEWVSGFNWMGALVTMLGTGPDSVVSLSGIASFKRPVGPWPSAVEAYGLREEMMA